MDRQVELYDTEHSSALMCWLPVDRRIKPGTVLTLKDMPGRRWTVIKVFPLIQDASRFNRGWNNNI